MGGHRRWPRRFLACGVQPVSVICNIFMACTLGLTCCPTMVAPGCRKPVFVDLPVCRTGGLLCLG